jgi:putative aminopeptidase FrvX
MSALLRKLSEAVGVSGREDEVRAILVEEIRGKADSARVDALGNLVATRRGTGSSKLRVMIAAHMDEVGLMVTLVEDGGMLRFARVGGIDERILPARPVTIGAKRVPGVIAFKPIHLTEKGETDRVTPAKDLVIDIGAASKTEAERLVARGDHACFLSEYVEPLAGSAWRTVQGKAFDDRAGCAIAAALLAERFPFDLVVAFTVQEEVGLRGAKVAAFAERPDCAFVLECTGANEVPVKKDLSPSTRLGAGPAITVMDSSFIADRRLVDLLVATASRLGIPYQFKQPNIGGTDAGAIQRVGDGVPSVTLAVPCRYIHSPAGILDLDDFDHALGLMRESLQLLPGAFERSAT